MYEIVNVARKIKAKVILLSCKNIKNVCYYNPDLTNYLFTIDLFFYDTISLNEV